jgi:hypothetical protein
MPNLSICQQFRHLIEHPTVVTCEVVVSWSVLQLLQCREKLSGCLLVQTWLQVEIL